MLALLFPLLTVYIHIHDACLFRVFLEPLTFTGTCLKSGFHQRFLVAKLISFATIVRFTVSL